MEPSWETLKPKPAWHTQAALPGSEMALSPHSRQALAPEAFMKVPAGQSQHADEAEASAYFPALNSAFPSSFCVLADCTAEQVGVGGGCGP